jgi:ABC-2 type transport system ATP-binding protein
MTARLSARGLSKAFGSRVAVDDVSIDLAAGRISALVGPNGAGKTTTLRMLAGLIAPDAGRLAMDGEPVAAHASSTFRRHIGLLTEAPGLWDRLTVRENLLAYARLYEIPGAEGVVDAALDRFGIADRRDERPAELSKGLRQRVSLARTLLHDPRIVLLDEPTSGLDPESARVVRRLVQELAEDGRAVLVCTHNLDEVERLAAQVAILRTRILAIDEPDALRRRLARGRVRVVLSDPAERVAAFLRSAGMHDMQVTGHTLVLTLGPAAGSVPDLVRLLVEAGARIEAIRPEVPSLEDAYLDVLAREGAS